MFKFLITLVEHISVIFQIVIYLAFLVCVGIFILLLAKICWIFLLALTVVGALIWMENASKQHEDLEDERNNRW